MKLLIVLILHGMMHFAIFFYCKFLIIISEKDLPEFKKN